MDEGFLYFIWQFLLFKKEDIIAITGEKIEIIHQGTRNYASGPDFFNARIKINDLVWAGNVEMHLKSSDWIAHNHQNDPAYKNVILHVVYDHDCNIQLNDGNTIPVIQLDFSTFLLQRYHALIKNKHNIHCTGQTKDIEPFKIKSYLSSIAVERLYEKSNTFKNLLISNKNDWEETFYIALAKNFGFNTNSLPFEMLARAVPLHILYKHKSSLLQIEALLYGQSGLLENIENANEYINKLLKEWIFLQKKYSLKPLDSSIWKFSGTRPNNFPSLRISQFAHVLFNRMPLFRFIIDNKANNEVIELFNITASEHWDNWFSFSAPSPQIPKRLGKSSFNNIIINTLSPFLYLYGTEKDNQDYIDLALELLETVPPENNTIINQWKNAGIIPVNAMETQALLQLYKKYCSNLRCIECTLGSTLIQKEM